MNVIDRFKQAKGKFEALKESHRTKKVKKLDRQVEVLERKQKVETLKTKVAVQKAKRKKVSGFGGVAQRIQKNNQKDDAPYWMKEKSKKPYWLK